MARRPSPNVTPFIPPLSSPNPSPHHQPLGSAPATPYVAPYTAFLPPASAPAAYPGYPAYPPFVSPQGLSADYAGYPAFLGPTPLTQPVHLPPPHPSPWTPPHTTPWAQPAQLPQYPPFQPQQAFYNPHATPAMPYGQFTPDPWGMPPQSLHPPNPRNLWPSHPQPPQPPPPQFPISRSAVYSADRVDPFLPGTCYGPVLTPFLVGVVHAEIKLNPLITPLPEDGSDKPHLRWNMLYTSNYCQRSDDKPHVSWSKGREAPATFPRVTSIRIITELMPWTVEVNAQNPAIGITCGEVIDCISDCMYRIASASDYNALPDPRKRAVSESYHHNRSVAADVPGGRLKHGMMRLDFLCKYSMYGGIELDNQFVKKTTGAALPCVVVLRCLKRPILTDSEARQHRERTKSLGRQPSATGDSKSAAPSATPASHQ